MNKIEVSTHPEKKRPNRIVREYVKHKYFFFMFVPILLYFFIFHYIPMYGALIAFKDFSPFQGFYKSPWVGLKYFRELFGGMYFLPVLRNTLIINFSKLIFSFPAPIILALLLNEVRCAPYKKFVQTVSYIPHFFSWVIIAGIIIEVLSPSRGIVNYVLQLFGLEPIFFMAEKSWFRDILVASHIWKEVGWGSIIYLAAIAGINPELYDVAEIDGAGRLRKIWSITLPSIRPVIVIMFIFATGGLINDNFDQVYNLLNVKVMEVGDVIGTYTYREGIMNMNYSYASAIGLFKNVISFSLVMTTNWLAKRCGEDSLF